MLVVSNAMMMAYFERRQAVLSGKSASSASEWHGLRPALIQNRLQRAAARLPTMMTSVPRLRIGWASPQYGTVH